MPKLKQLIFDADDTLWDNNKYFVQTTALFFDLCIKSGFDRAYVENEFYKYELNVVNEKGYGSENFIFILEYLYKHLNKIIKIDRKQYNDILDKFVDFTEQKPLLFPGVYDILSNLKKEYNLFILTKGNIKEQKNKIKSSGLQHFFSEEFVVSEKDDQIYKDILLQHKWKPEECCMIGNSPKSDINPALRNGLYAIYVPYEYTWNLDNENLAEHNSKLFKVSDFSELPAILNKLSKL